MRELAKRLAAIEALESTDLRTEWERAYKAPAPHLSAELLRLGIAWRLQEKQFGGHGRTVRQLLKAQNDIEVSAAQRRKLTPGTRLVRDWHGIGHSVTVLENGFDYNGQRWTSLTAIARHITGAKWSGPRFFGLAGAQR